MTASIVSKSAQEESEHPAKRLKQDNTENVPVDQPTERFKNDPRSLMRPTDASSIVFPLSQRLRGKLSSFVPDGALLGKDLSYAVCQMLGQSDLLWKGHSQGLAVFKLDSDAVVKAVRNLEDTTEYTALQYLAKNMPDFPVPKPLGLITLGRFSLIFMTYMPGITLDKVWGTLDKVQKSSIQQQLDALFAKLRSLPHPDGMSLGGVAGEGCKDIRRNIRRSQEPITSQKAFEDFQFSNPHFGSPIFISFLRQLSPSPSGRCVFTHGDVRPENITVELSDDDGYRVTGLLDWEASGFYPKHQESTKITNCLATNEESDWYLFLPPCISPHEYPQRWLLDRVWDRHVE
jgi:hypothetical protein